MTERTLVLVKPDGVGPQADRRGPRPASSARGSTSSRSSCARSTASWPSQHYAEHDGKPFFESLLEFITSGPVVAAVVEGPRAIAAFRQLAGGTDPVEKAAPGTIRGDFALETQYNLVHGSDSPESRRPRDQALVPDRSEPTGTVRGSAIIGP